MCEPRVTIIIPVYNVEKYIDECLHSVVNQTYKNLEIICVDDCGNDTSLMIVEQYAISDKRVKVIKHVRNKGAAASRNTGLDVATGKYIFFLDSDDILHPDAIKRMVYESEGNNLDVFGINIKQFSGKFGDMGTNVDIAMSYDVLCGQECFIRLVSESRLRVEVCGVLFMKSLLDECRIRFKEGVIYEDNIFSFRVYMNAKRMAFVETELYYYRQRLGSVMNGGSSVNKKLQSELVLLSELFFEWKKHEGNSELDKRIARYFSKEIKCLKELYHVADSSDECDLSYAPERTLYNLLFNYENQLVYVEIKSEDIEHIRCYNKVYVYGAGRAAEEVVNTLRKHEISIENIVLTDKNKKNEFMGIPVIGVSELVADGDCVVVLGTTEKYHDAIKDTLKRHGIVDVIEPENIK